jgi:hypothetical protein
VKPKIPGLEAPFICLNSTLVSAGNVSSPSIFCALCSVSLRLFSSSSGFVSPSEFRKSIMSCLLFARSGVGSGVENGLKGCGHIISNYVAVGDCEVAHVFS